MAFRRATAIAIWTLCAGCATTVHRLGRETQLPAGPAKTSCEEEDWLVLSETRAEVVPPEAKVTQDVHGLAAYRVGSKDPEDITDLPATNPIVVRKRNEVRPFHVRRYIAAGLGILGAGTMAAGTGIFVSGFQSVPNGMGQDVQQVNSTLVGGGAITVGIGFALGIAGLIVNPSHAERTRANASHFFFDPSQDERTAIDQLIIQHDEVVRDRCLGK